MKKLLFTIIGLLFALPASAQVQSQNQIIIPSYGGVIMATSTNGNSKLSASTSPTVNWITATSTLQASTLPYASSTSFTVSGAFYNTLSNGCVQIISNLLTSTGVACGSGSSVWATTSSDYYASQFRDFSVQGNGYLAPTTTRGIFINSSSTISALTVTNGTTTSATSTNLYTDNQTVLAGTAGRVGIATSTPAQGILEVNGNAVISSASANAFVVGPNGLSAPAFQVIASAASSANGISITTSAAASGVSVASISSGANESLSLSSKGTGGATIKSGSTGNVTMATGATTRLFVQGSTGNVGIGTTTPWGFLSVNSVNSLISRPQFIVASSSVAVGTTTPFIITNEGLVGISTTSPYALLSVAGSIVGQDFTATSTTATSTIQGVLSVDQGSNTLPGNAWFRVGSSTSNIIVDKVSGNTGIGTSSPFAPLSVTGATYIGNNLTATGTINFTGLSTGCLQSTSGAITSTGVACGSGAGGSWATSSNDYYASQFRDWSLTGSPLYLAPTTSRAILVNNATSTITNLTMVNSTSTNATTTSLAVTAVKSALDLNDSNGVLTAYTGTSCTAQFVRSVSATGVATCAKVANTDLSNASMTLSSTNSTLTIGGSPQVLGGLPFTADINLGSANLWTASTTFVGGLSSITSTSTYATSTNLYTSGQTILAATSGNTGVGTTSPYAVLSVYNNTNPTSFAVGSTSSTTLSVTNTGRVGIGTASPLADLQIFNNNTPGASPSIIMGGNEGFDTDFWIGRQNDNDRTNNDSLRFGTSTVPGTNTFLTMDYTGYIGIGTTTPRWPLQISASTTSQLSLSDGSLTSPQSVLRSINGNLFIATSSPATFSTSTTANPNRGYVEFPSNGGCINCSDIILSGGINLRNAKYVNATSSNFTANTYNTVYTAPANTRTLVYGWNSYNNTAGAIVYTVQALIGGVPYLIQASTTASSKGAASGKSSNFILEPGESLQVSQSVSGAINISIFMIEFDASTPFYSARAINPTTATSTLYTAPTNASAACVGINVFSYTDGVNGSTFGSCSVMAAFTPSASMGGYWLVKSGQTASVDVNQTTNAASPATPFAVTLPFTTLPSPVAFNAGDSLQFRVITTLTGTRNLLWMDVYEH